MIYIITKGAGKEFISSSRLFKFTIYPGDVIALEDSEAAKTWSDQQVLFNEGRIVDKATAQSAIDAAFNIDANAINSPTPTKPIL